MILMFVYSYKVLFVKMVTFSDFTTVGEQAYHMVVAQLFIYFYDSTCVTFSKDHHL